MEALRVAYANHVNAYQSQHPDRWASARLRRLRTCVTLTFAQSLDGSIASAPGLRTALSGPESRELTHYLRSQNACILVGIGTVLADNPSLRTRLVEGTSPRPVILDGSLRMSLESALLRPEGRRPLIFCSQEAFSSQSKRVHDLSPLADMTSVSMIEGQLDLREVFSALWSLGYASVMVEGGAQVIQSVLRDCPEWIGSVFLTISPQFMGGYRCLTSPLSVPMRLASPKTSVSLGEDVIIAAPGVLV